MRRPFQSGRGNTPKFYLYKMTVDDGGAPCVQDGVLSLAICKPTIRRTASEGCVIIGFAADKLKTDDYVDNSIVYAAEVTRKLEVPGEYYSKREYAARPDCIYEWAGKRLARKSKALFHTEEGHLEHDLGTFPDYKNAIVLLSEGAKNFRYFGNRRRVHYKEKFPLLKEEVERLSQGTRVNHSKELYKELRRLKKQLWEVRSSFSHTPVPAKPDNRCDWDDYAVECDGG